MALVELSGSGKTSVTESVLGLLVEGLAPIPVPVYVETPEIVTALLGNHRRATCSNLYWKGASSSPPGQGTGATFRPIHAAEGCTAGWEGQFQDGPLVVTPSDLMSA